MNVLLWVLQALLAVAFLAHGWLFLFLTLPGIRRVMPWLIPWAAAGLMIVMLGATILHGMRGEVGSAITTAILFIVATFVAYMRWKVNPILPRLRA